MPRRLTIFLESPPTDGLRYAQDHFKEYVKPILVASGLDWEFVQGRKEGDVRAELAEKLRKVRTPFNADDENEDPILRTRASNGTKDYDGPQGDIVIGRNTWKEYVRGLHEGWLGPLEAPPRPELPEEAAEIKAAEAPASVKTDAGITLLSEPRDATPEEQNATPKAEDEKPKKPKQPPPFITTAEYSSASLPSQIPAEFAPANPVTIPHILGFLNTPTRFVRFLNRRKLQDNIGREVAAILLHDHGRPYDNNVAGSGETASYASDSPANDDAEDGRTESQTSEQSLALIHEEKDWHKNIHKPIPDVPMQPERTWLEPMVLDPRIASRMRRAELTAEEEARAASIVIPEEEIEGWIKGSLRSLVKETVKWAKGENKQLPTDVGNPDVDSVTGEGPPGSNAGFVPGTVGGMRVPQPQQPLGRLSRFQ